MIIFNGLFNSTLNGDYFFKVNSNLRMCYALKSICKLVSEMHGIFSCRNNDTNDGEAPSMLETLL